MPDATRLPAWKLPLLSNRLLVAGATIELAFAMAMLLMGPLAEFLDHRNPPLVGWLIALASMPLVVLADALVKRWAVAPRRRARSA